MAFSILNDALNQNLINSLALEVLCLVLINRQFSKP